MYRKKKNYYNRKCKKCFWTWYDICVNPFCKDYGDKILFIDSRKCKCYATEEEYNKEKTE